MNGLNNKNEPVWKIKKKNETDDNNWNVSACVCETLVN